MKFKNKSVLFVSIAIAVFVLALLLCMCNQKESFSTQEVCEAEDEEGEKKGDWYVDGKGRGGCCYKTDVLFEKEKGNWECCRKPDVYFEDKEGNKKCCYKPDDNDKDSWCKYYWCKASEGERNPGGKRKGRGGCYRIWQKGCVNKNYESESELEKEKVLRKCKNVFGSYDKTKYKDAKIYFDGDGAVELENQINQ